MKSIHQKRIEALARRKHDLEAYRQTLNNPRFAQKLMNYDDATMKDSLTRAIQRAEFDIMNLETKLR